MTEEDRTAYHEAGHCYFAFTNSMIAFRGVCIRELHNHQGRWEGETKFKRSWLSLPVRACTAISGSLAEARALASEHTPRKLSYHTSLREAISQLFATELPKTELQQTEHFWSLNISVVGGEPVGAIFTRADLNEIPAECHTDERIASALEFAIETINDPVHWAAITAIATELKAHAPQGLNALQVYQAIRAATASYLEAEEGD